MGVHPGGPGRPAGQAQSQGAGPRRLTGQYVTVIMKHSTKLRVHERCGIDRYSKNAVQPMWRPLVYRLQSIQTRPPTNPSNAARRIDPDPVTAPAPPLPDWVAPIRDRKRGAANGR